MFRLPPWRPGRGIFNEVNITSLLSDFGQVLVWHGLEKVVYSWVYPIVDLKRGCRQAERMKAAAADDPRNGASMIDQIIFHTLGRVHPSRAIPTSVHVEKASCVKKNKINGL